ncbi:MAG TPA: hypothetical protein VFQ59_02780 [Candidatus Paceibacterota bacterium]|nr:hypothetical protein [Candidatus Paceibacterota bacterium]
MKTASLTIKRGIANAGVVNGGELNRRILHALLFTLGALAFMYVLFLGRLVFDIVDRKALESEARSLANEVSALEVKYLSVSDSIDLNLSLSLGYKEAHPEYATRKSLGSLVTLKNEI